MSSIVIRGGTVIDETGAPGVEADVLVKDGRIAAIGSRLSGEQELDAGGGVVAPRFIDIQANDDPEGIEHLLQQEQMAIGLSDAGAHVGMLCDAPLPTDLLGNWVRERSVIPLETAVHKLTGEPAGIFRFEDRGEIREGAHADICVFEPDEIGPGKVRRIQDFPGGADRLTADSPRGIRHVLVNGTPISQEGKLLTSALDRQPGQRPAQ